jgi:UDP-glucose 4-epimerase
LVVNVGTGEQTSLRDLWSSIAGLSGKEPQFKPADDDEINRFAVSPMRARIHLSWSPWTPLADGLVQLR